MAWPETLALSPLASQKDLAGKGNMGRTMKNKEQECLVLVSTEASGREGEDRHKWCLGVGRGSIRHQCVALWAGIHHRGGQETPNYKEMGLQEPGVWNR